MNRGSQPRKRSAIHLLGWTWLAYLRGPWACALAFLLCSCSLQGEAPPQTIFDAANKLYYEGKFSEAAAAYEQLIHSGRASAAVFFNLGNAWFKSGQLGRAIGAYLQAENLTPRDPDIRANLQFAREQRQGPTMGVSRWHRWFGKLSLNEWTLLASGTVWIWLLLLALLQWRPAWKRNVRGLVIVSALAAVLCCGCLLAAFLTLSSVQTAIVISAKTSALQSPLDTAKEAFALHDGAEVRVLERKSNWLLVTTDPRRVGWVRKDQVLASK